MWGEERNTLVLLISKNMYLNLKCVLYYFIIKSDCLHSVNEYNLNSYMNIFYSSIYSINIFEHLRVPGMADTGP